MSRPEIWLYGDWWRRGFPCNSKGWPFYLVLMLALFGLEAPAVVLAAHIPNPITSALPVIVGFIWALVGGVIAMIHTGPWINRRSKHARE